MTITTRWFIRTSIKNYYAVSDTENRDTFICTPALPTDGVWEQPKPVTFCCPYIVEENQRDLPVKLPPCIPVRPFIEASKPVVFVLPQ